MNCWVCNLPGNGICRFCGREQTGNRGQGIGGSPAPAPSTLPPVPSDDILDLLSHLVDNSLVVHEVTAQGQSRYRFLETIDVDDASILKN